jgi:hypothetical protein
VRQGARAYVIGGWGGAWERLRVLARSRSGRWVRLWEDYRHLTDFHLTTIVPECGDYDRILAGGSLHHALSERGSSDHQRPLQCLERCGEGVRDRVGALARRRQWEPRADRHR